MTHAVLKFFGTEARTLTWPVSFLSAFIGTYSHILFDAVMHADMNPLWPLASGNAMLEFMSIGWLHILCVASGRVGIVAVLVRGKP